MKTNEAPEKIYLLPRQGGYYAPYWRTDSQDGFGIEYTRTDAFIEKTCEYFRERLEDTKVIDDYRDKLVPGISAGYTSVEEFIEDFKNYIKEE